MKPLPQPLHSTVRRRRAAAGFTLLELIVVMVIVALGTAIVGVSINRLLFDPQQVDVAEQMQMDLVRMRNRASIDDAAVTIYVDFKFQNMSAYSITGQELLQVFLPDDYTFEPDIIRYDGTTGEVEASSDERVIIVFQPDGTALDGSFLLRMPDNERRRIVVRGGSGRVLLLNPDGSEAGT